MVSTLDRSAHNVRKKGEKCRKAPEAFFRRIFSPRNVYQIADRFQRIKRNSDGCDESELRCNIQMNDLQTSSICFVDDFIPDRQIFKHCQKNQLKRKARSDQQTALRPVCAFFHQKGTAPRQTHRTQQPDACKRICPLEKEDIENQ